MHGINANLTEIRKFFEQSFSKESQQYFERKITQLKSSTTGVAKIASTKLYGLTNNAARKKIVSLIIDLDAFLREYKSLKKKLFSYLESYSSS